MPDAAGLDLIAEQLTAVDDACLIGHSFDRGHAELEIEPAKNISVLQWLKDRGYNALASLHGVDYYPHEPRLGVIYELLDMHEVDRISVKARVSVESPDIASVVPLWTGANADEREVYDMFGVIFTGHPDLRRILMPEDYEGFPQRRDFPVGGEPVLFTFNEKGYGEDR